MWDSQAVPAVAVTYADAYMKASVVDKLCNFSFGTTNAATGAAGVTPVASPMLTVFGLGNGLPLTNGINLVYSQGTTGAADHRLATADASYAGGDMHALAMDERQSDHDRERQCEPARQADDHRAGPRRCARADQPCIAPVSRREFGAVAEGSRAMSL